MIKVTPRLDERINARWLIWHPWMIMAAKKKLPYIPLEQSLGAARDLHKQRYVQAINAGVREVLIRQRGLDDPRIDDLQFRATIENILRYKRAQMGNRNGLYSKKSKELADAVKA
jgi:hypothetical protein